MISRELINLAPEFVSLAPIIALAFSAAIRKAIGKRDRWTCQDCGDQFKDGVMVHASHYNHDKSLPIYDSADNGRIQCVDCHQAFHELHVGNASEIGLTENGNLAAIALLDALDRGTTQK